jgi:hypothetical protein
LPDQLLLAKTAEALPALRVVGPARRVERYEMTRFLFPVFLITLGVLGLVEHDAINAQWTAMYPDDPVRQVALQHCFEDNHQFNRLNPTARSFCYQKYLPEIIASQPLLIPAEAEQTQLISVVARDASPMAPEISVRLAALPPSATSVAAQADGHASPRSSPLADIASSLGVSPASAATISDPIVMAAPVMPGAYRPSSPPFVSAGAEQTQLIPVVADNPAPPRPELRVQLATPPKPAPPDPAQIHSGSTTPPTPTVIKISSNLSATTVIAMQAASWPPVLAPLPSDVDR